MLYGTVVQWFPAKGFGFIGVERGSDVFFHASALGGCQIINVEIGQPVKYELVEGSEPVRRRRDKDDLLDGVVPAKPKAPQAKFVEFIDKIPGKIIEIAEDNSRIAHHPKARRKKPNWRR